MGLVQAPNSVSMPLNLFGWQRQYFSSRFVPGIELAPRRYNQAIPFCHAFTRQKTRNRKDKNNKNNANIFSSFIYEKCTLQRENAENFKQIFPEKECRGLSPEFQIHVSVSELYIPTMGLSFLILGIYKSLTDT